MSTSFTSSSALAKIHINNYVIGYPEENLRILTQIFVFRLYCCQEKGEGLCAFENDWLLADLSDGASVPRCESGGQKGAF